MQNLRGIDIAVFVLSNNKNRSYILCRYESGFFFRLVYLLV
nr:MAG TPA: hypothetical protein [Caudoviricetes sp.]